MIDNAIKPDSFDYFDAIIIATLGITGCLCLTATYIAYECISPLLPVVTYKFTAKGASVGESILIVGLVLAMTLYGQEEEVPLPLPPPPEPYLPPPLVSVPKRKAKGDLFFILIVTHRGSQVILDVPKTVLAKWTTFGDADDFTEENEYNMTLDPRLELDDLKDYIEYSEKGIAPIRTGPLIELSNYLGDCSILEKLYLKHLIECDSGVNKHFPQEMQLNLKINYEFRKTFQASDKSTVNVPNVLKETLEKFDLKTPLEKPIDLNLGPLVTEIGYGLAMRELIPLAAEIEQLVPQVGYLVIGSLQESPSIPKSWAKELQGIEYIDCLPDKTIMPKLKHFGLRFIYSAKELAFDFTFLKSSPKLTSISFIASDTIISSLPSNQSIKSVTFSGKTSRYFEFPSYPLLEELVVREHQHQYPPLSDQIYNIPNLIRGKLTTSREGYTTYRFKPN